MAYRLEYASSARSKCKGPKPCKDTMIGKGELRLGSMVTIQERQSMQWRHWGCTTPKILSNIANALNDATEIDGYEDLRPEDQEKVKKAYEEGAVADEDIPDTARKPAAVSGDEEEEGGKGSKAKSKKKAPPAKKPSASASASAHGSGGTSTSKAKPKGGKKGKKVESEEEEEAVSTGDEAMKEEEEEKPKKKKAAPKKKKAKESEEENVEEEDEEPKPKAKRAGRPKK